MSAFQDTSSTYEAEACHMPFDFDHGNPLESTSYPAPNLLSFIWQTYVKNVDPFIKVLHVPTMSEVIRLSEGGFDNLSLGTRALLFSISLAAVTSLSDTDVRTLSLRKARAVTDRALGTKGIRRYQGKCFITLRPEHRESIISSGHPQDDRPMRCASIFNLS